MDESSTLVSYNPATGERLGTAPICSREAVEAAVQRARRAQEDWAKRSVGERARALRALKRVLVDQSDALAGLEVAEQGKNQVEAYGTVLTLTYLLRYYARKAPRVLGSRRVWPLLGLLRSHRVLRVPYGVVGVISPWNYPLTLSMEPILAALFAGNSVVLKPSEFTPRVGLAIGELFRQAQLPEGLVEVVTGDGTTGAALVDSEIDRLVFTGSVDTGRRVAELAAKRLLPLTLELGGKDAAIVLDDADLERAVAGIAWGANLNAGQACLAIERVYVVESVAERFIERITDTMARLRIGDGSDADTDVAAITTEAQIETIQAHVDDALERGAKLGCGGERLPGAGRFYRPTVLTNVSDEMRVMREETFGPVIGIQTVRDESEALRLTNASPYGLTCSIWTRNIRRGRRLARKIDAGDVAVNEHGAPAGHAEIPWGGVKQSGYGRTRGVDGLLEMTVPKHLSWPRWQSRREAFWFPYSEKTINLIRRGIYILHGSWSERISALFGKGPRKEPRD